MGWGGGWGLCIRKGRGGAATPTSLARSEAGENLYVEAEFYYVAVLDDVVFAFNAEAAGFAGLGEGAEANEVVEVGDFGGDETALEVGVDDAGGGRCFVTGVDGPCASFGFAGGEVGAKAEQMIDGADEGADAALADAETGEVFPGFVFGEVDEFALDLGGDDDGLGGEMGADVVLDGLDVTGGGVDGGVDVPGEAAFLLLGGVDIGGEVSEVGLGDVAGEDDGF